MNTFDNYRQYQTSKLNPILTNERITSFGFDETYNLNNLFERRDIYVDEIISNFVKLYDPDKVYVNKVNLISYDIAQLYRLSCEVNKYNYNDERVLGSIPRFHIFQAKDLWILIGLMMCQKPERPMEHQEDSKNNFLAADEETGVMTTIRPNIYFFYTKGRVIRIFVSRLKSQWYISSCPRGFWFPGVRVVLLSG